MLTIPSQAIYDLKAAVVIELARLIEIQNSLSDDDDWPKDYDANDIPIYFMILKDLLEWDYKTDLDYPHTGKFLWFMIMLIPEYIKKNMKHMSHVTYMALRKVYLDGGGWRNVALPEWPSGEKEH